MHKADVDLANGSWLFSSLTDWDKDQPMGASGGIVGVKYVVAPS